jgi:hypothetical protein
VREEVDFCSVRTRIIGILRMMLRARPGFVMGASEARVRWPCNAKTPLGVTLIQLVWDSFEVFSLWLTLSRVSSSLVTAKIQ